MQYVWKKILLEDCMKTICEKFSTRLENQENLLHKRKKYPNPLYWGYYKMIKAIKQKNKQTWRYSIVETP
jgi:hypothetical protein